MMVKLKAIQIQSHYEKVKTRKASYRKRQRATAPPGES